MSDLNIDEQRFNRFINSKVGKKVLNIIQDENLTDTEGRILKSLLWYREAMSQLENYQRFGFLFIAVECLLLPKEEEVPNLKCKCGKELGTLDFNWQAKEFRGRIKTLISDPKDFDLKLALLRMSRGSEKQGSLKKIRNLVFHSGFTEITPEDIRHIKIIYEHALFGLLGIYKLPTEIRQNSLRVKA